MISGTTALSGNYIGNIRFYSSFFFSSGAVEASQSPILEENPEDINTSSEDSEEKSSELLIEEKGMKIRQLRCKRSSIEIF